MTKPAHIWLTLSICGLIIVSAMGWLTTHVVDLESERARAVEESDLQNRVRLALAAMDTAASGLLVIENQRPPYHFRAFYNPGDVFDASFNNYEQSQVLRPSPLANDLPEFVKLHFEILPNGTVTSPQVPQVDDGIWGRILNPSQKVLTTGNANFECLNEILVAPAAKNDLPAGVSNGTVLRDVVNEPAPDAEEQEAKDKASGGKGDWVAQQVIESTAQERIQSPSYQAEFSKVERGNRKRVFEDTLKKAAEESSNIGQNTYGVAARRSLDGSLGRGDEARAYDQVEEVPDRSLAQAGAALPSPQAPGLSREDLSPSVLSEFDQARDEPIPTPEATVSPFRVLWLAGELFAVRRVEIAGEERFQGVWFEAKKLERYLLEAVSHYLPSASLEPFGSVASLTEGVGEVALDDLQDDPLALVTMPWRLRPGEIAKTSSFQFTQVHLALGVGWVAVLFALLAAAILVRGVLKLSERRASFVSSVTHELRTPLTTFQLYSDLLAEGMVTDPEKKQNYLETLRQEAGRLNHLVENVLAYSRIERGASKTRKESLALSGLVDRLRPRLEDRVRDGGMSLELEVEENCAERTVETDPGAVEQILFNLVDNACKYGRRDGPGGEVQVKISCRGKRVRMEVQDNGEGIPRGDRRRLFRPFQKAARDEGDTKPGVGLGLSLCRRLARALGGDLRLAAVRKPGACFVLELPGG